MLRIDALTLCQKDKLKTKVERKLKNNGYSIHELDVAMGWAYNEQEKASNNGEAKRIERGEKESVAEAGKRKKRERERGRARL